MKVCNGQQEVFREVPKEKRAIVQKELLTVVCTISDEPLTPRTCLLKRTCVCYLDKLKNNDAVEESVLSFATFA